MAAASGFYRGTGIEQDVRMANKQKKILSQLKYEDSLSAKVDLKKCNLEIIKPWMARRITEVLNGFEDDVVIEYAFSQLEAKTVDPREMQANLTGFLNAKRAREFMGELWALLDAAQKEADGIPPQLVEEKMRQIQKQRDEAAQASSGVNTKEERAHEDASRPRKSLPSPVERSPRRHDERNRREERRDRRDRRQAPTTSANAEPLPRRRRTDDDLLIDAKRRRTLEGGHDRYHRLERRVENSHRRSDRGDSRREAEERRRGDRERPDKERRRPAREDERKREGEKAKEEANSAAKGKQYRKRRDSSESSDEEERHEKERRKKKHKKKSKKEKRRESSESDSEAEATADKSIEQESSLEERMRERALRSMKAKHSENANKEGSDKGDSDA